jgi:uncharacterized protein YbaP (TraB family)
VGTATSERMTAPAHPRATLQPLRAALRSRRRFALLRFVAVLTAALVCVPALAAPAAWRIAGKNGGEVALLGSMHVLRAADYPLPKLVDELYARADVLVMELDLDDPNLAGQQSVLLKAATLPQGKVLRDVVDASLYRDAAERARDLGFDIGLLEHMEPWLVAITLLDVGMQRIGFEAQRGLEQYLARKAADDDKAITGLESLAMQIGIFSDLSADEQEAMLAQTVQELEEAEKVMVDLVTAWRDGRLELLSEGLLADFDDFPELYETLVTKRNAAWTLELERLLTDGRKHLVVVGALHLVGRDSVIDRLAARGHRVTRVGETN